MNAAPTQPGAAVALHSRRPPLAREPRAPGFRGPRGETGFSLVELLVVIAIIALLVSALGLALNDSGGSSLASAQNTLATLVGTTRAQAAVNQTDARLLIYGTRPPSGDTGKFLRMLRIVTNQTPGSANPSWLPVGDPIYLPRGVYVVPPNVTSGFVLTGLTWPTIPAPVSTLLPVARYTIVNDQPGNDTYYAVEFKADGTLNTSLGNQSYAKLAVATATIANSLPQFNNTGAVRGLLLRPTGAVTFVNDPLSF